MPEHLRSLIVILVIAISFFSFTNHTSCSISHHVDITRRRNLWFALTLAAFISHNYWLYVLISLPLLIYTNLKEHNPPALYFFILFALPVANIEIPGMGLVNYLFEISHPRLLALIILLPTYISLLRRVDTPSFGSNGPDKALSAYLLLTAILNFRESNLTNYLRELFYLFIDVFLPYFVISRSLKNLSTFRDALLSLVLGIMVLAPLAVVESFKHWLLYSSLDDALNIEGTIGYLAREGMLRAVVTAGQTIPLGYLMVVGMGIYMFIQRFIKQRLSRQLGFLLLLFGLIVPLSRGPWLGAAVLVVVFIATGRYALGRLMKLVLAAILSFALISLLPGGEKIINLLPIIGSTEKENIDYRENLIVNSIIVIKRNPWFGTANSLRSPELEALRQSSGVIDIVNSYIRVTLEKGLVGLGLFVAFFALTLLSIYRGMHSIQDKNREEYLLGRALLATLTAILIIIFTVSSITFIPIMYWCVAALGVAYERMIRNNSDLKIPSGSEIMPLKTDRTLNVVSR